MKRLSLVHALLVLGQTPVLCTLVVALVALIRFLTTVSELVLSQMTTPCSLVVALIALEGFIAGMCPLVLSQITA